MSEAIKKEKEEQKAKKLVREFSADKVLGSEFEKRAEDEYNAIVTKERLKACLPKGSRTNISEEILSLANRMGDDTGLPQEDLARDLYGYMHFITKISGIGARDVIDAVKYCNLKRHMNNEDAWKITFPHRYMSLKEKGTLDKMSVHAAMYNGRDIVQLIDKEMMIPVHLQYAPYMHAAIKKQFDIMNGDGCLDKDGRKMTVTPMVQHLASKELYEMTKIPEELKVAVTVGQTDAMLEAQQTMNKQLESIIRGQAEQFKAGMDTADIQKIHMKMDDDVIDVDAVSGSVQ